MLLKFINHEIIFRANPPNNDLWLDISLSTPKHEESLVYIIQELLGIHYRPLRGIPIIVHC